MQNNLYHMEIRTRVSRSIFAEENENGEWRIYVNFAQLLIKIARDLYAPGNCGISTAFKVASQISLRKKVLRLSEGSKLAIQYLVLVFFLYANFFSWGRLLVWSAAKQIKIRQILREKLQRQTIKHINKG